MMKRGLLPFAEIQAQLMVRAERREVFLGAAHAALNVPLLILPLPLFCRHGFEPVFRRRVKKYI
jgi:hypothetical protein